ncbi:hypothetical protein MtrunA17_Chr7g0247211 [Medicago truncatula]|uniref:Transmembrane protein n=1 Tax=Medicago truncatula TaxID=3880 RepID=A0A396H7E8_MEDTR|nr:hypothetical protein MtrunA17_Chr7g0247211 [Medicago truncatula]
MLDVTATQAGVNALFEDAIRKLGYCWTLLLTVLSLIMLRVSMQ